MRVVRRLSKVGFLVLLAGLTTTGCSDPSGSARSQPKSSATLPTSYHYVLTSSCGERSLLGSYRVVVHDDAVVSVESLNADYPYRPRPEDVPTLADLLDLAAGAERDAVIDLRVDAHGVPVSLAIDHVPNGIDDEECYEVSELRALSPAESR
jgi:hypothetical protein